MPKCPECDSRYAANGGGHCRGGAYGGCCRTFSSDTAFDAHRRGPFTERYCLDVTALPGWREARTGWTRAERRGVAL